MADRVLIQATITTAFGPKVSSHVGPERDCAALVDECLALTVQTGFPVQFVFRGPLAAMARLRAYEHFARSAERVGA